MRIFETKSSSLDWSTVRNENVEEYVDCFNSRINELYCECFQFQSKLSGIRQVLNLWITLRLKKSFET